LYISYYFTIAILQQLLEEQQQQFCMTGTMTASLSRLLFLLFFYIMSKMPLWQLQALSHTAGVMVTNQCPAFACINGSR